MKQVGNIIGVDRIGYVGYNLEQLGICGDGGSAG